MKYSTQGERAKAVIDMRKQGLTYKEIANKTGASLPVVNRIINNYHLDGEAIFENERPISAFNNIPTDDEMSAIMDSDREQLLSRFITVDGLRRYAKKIHVGDRLPCYNELGNREILTVESIVRGDYVVGVTKKGIRRTISVFEIYKQRLI
jgi:hypothetical protein